jgi:hypothetical protein
MTEVGKASIGDDLAGIELISFATSSIDGGGQRGELHTRKNGIRNSCVGRTTIQLLQYGRLYNRNLTCKIVGKTLTPLSTKKCWVRLLSFRLVQHVTDD